MSSDAQERTEEATPRKREQARKRGSVARSTELNGSLILMGLVVLVPASMAQIGTAFIQSFHTAWGQLGAQPSLSQSNFVFQQLLAGVAPGLAMLLFSIMGIGLASNFGQVGFVLSGEALTPKLNRIDPMQGFKRLFSRNAIIDGMKAAGKSSLFAYVAYTVIQSNWQSILGLSYLPPMVAFATLGSIIKTLAVRVGMTWLVLAALDTFYQRKKLSKELRMSKEEVKQEMKEMEQSMELKMAIAKRRRQLSKRMMEAVKTADVIVTNPTHFSVAIKYDPAQQHAPQVVAKGVDLIAFKIREVANEHGVAIVPNPPLARALYKKCEIGDFVPRDYFVPVAEVLAFVYRTVKKVKQL